MGRAGSGSHGGGSHHSGGSHSVGRSSSSHHVSSSRAGSGSYRSSGGPSYHGGGPHYGGGGYYHHPPRIHYGGYHHTTVIHEGSGGSSALVTIIAWIAIFAIIIAAIAINSGGSGSVPKSTIVREKITGYSYDSNCIVDELGWFDNKTRTSTQLKDFFNETGVQPYIVLRAYDPAMTSDSIREQYAEQYFEEQGLNENGFLYMYFAAKDQDNDVGDMCCVTGLETGTVMDPEAIEIFWSYVDANWYSDMSTDDLFIKVFDKTGDRIMEVSKTGSTWTKIVITVILVVVALIIVFVMMSKKMKRAKEKAAEDQKILETPLEQIKSSTDDTVDKYL